MNLIYHFLILTAITPSMLIDGLQPSCASLQVEVETTSGNYQQVTGSVIHRPANATNLTMRCQCTDGNETPHWAPPSHLTPSPCNNQSDHGVCFEKQTKWLQIRFSIVKKIHEGHYSCYSFHSAFKFIFLVYGPPVIKQPQYDTDVLLNNSSVTLQCRAIGHGPLTYQWEQKILGDWIVIGDNNMTSYITRDSGQYRCIVTDSEFFPIVSPVFTVYASKTTIIIHPVNTTIKALTSVTFTCSASHVFGVAHSYSWHRNNGDIPSTRSTGQDTNTLTITRAIPPDEGMYYCIATNDGGSTSSRSASLTVDDELFITVSPLNQTVSEGRVATFTATATGIKTREFEYEWFTFERLKSITVGRKRNLIINDVRVENEGSYYSCVKNEWNNMKCSPTVNLTISAVSFAFTTHPQDQFIYNKDDAVFECVVNENKSFTISWTRNNEYASNSHSGISINITNEGKGSVLQILKATKESIGIYQCIGTNVDNETITSKPAELLILPSMNTHPDNVTVLTGQSVDLTCSATGTDVVYQWMRNGAIISDDNSNVLRINEIKQSDDGTYQCIASNKGGNATSNPAMIIVYDSKDDDHVRNIMVAVVIILVLLIISVCCLVLIITVFILYKTKKQPQDEAKSTSNEELNASNLVYSKSTNDSHLLNNPSYQVTDNQETFIHHDYEILDVNNTVSSLVSTDTNHSVDNPFYQVTDNQETFIHHDYEILNTVSSLVSTDTSHSVDNPFYQVENAQDTSTNHDYEIINNN